MPKLTKRMIEELETRKSDYFIWDNDLPGFGVRALPTAYETRPLKRPFFRVFNTSKGRNFRHAFLTKILIFELVILMRALLTPLR